MRIVICCLLGYLLGTINFAYIFGKLHGFDIRSRGSGNAGATNVTMIIGKSAGVLCAALDIFKSYTAYKLARLLFPALAFAGVLAGCCSVLGHIFPAWMHFSGGKGVACIGGMILAHDARLFLIFLITEILLTLVTQYICVMPLSLCILFPAVYAWQTGDVTGTLILLTLVPVIVYKHLPNIRRILAGKEMRVSWLWNPQREESRIQKNFTEEEWSQLSRKVNHK